MSAKRRANPEDCADQIAAALDAKIEALRCSIERHPGSHTDAKISVNDIRIVWVAQPGACIDCQRLAHLGPYRRGEIPTWPGANDTRCEAGCRCEIQAFGPDFNAAFEPKP